MTYNFYFQTQPTFFTKHLDYKPTMTLSIRHLQLTQNVVPHLIQNCNHYAVLTNSDFASQFDV